MKSDAAAGPELRRVHPASMLFFLAKGIKEMYGMLPLLPLLVLWVPRATGLDVSRVVLGALLGGLGLAALLAAAWLRWRRFGYAVEAGSIRIEQGVWSRRTVWIQQERIQSVDTRQNLAERALGLLQLRIETAGGGEKAEAVLPSLSAAEAARLQRLLGYAEAGPDEGGEADRWNEPSAGADDGLRRAGAAPVPIGARGGEGDAPIAGESRSGEGDAPMAISARDGGDDAPMPGDARVLGDGGLMAAPGAERQSLPSESAAPAAARRTGEPVVQRRIRPSDLLGYALTSYRTGIVFLLLAGLLSRAADSGWLRGIDLRDEMERLFGAYAIAAATGLLLVAAWLLTALQLLNSNWGFRLERRGRKLHVERGLLEKKRQTIDISRIQALELAQPLLHRPLGWVAVRAFIAGNADEKERHLLLFPVLKRAEAEAFLRGFAPAFALPADWSRVERSAWSAYAGWPALFALLPAAAGWIWIPDPYRWLTALVPAAVLVYGTLEHRHAAWALEGGQLSLRLGALIRSELLLPGGRIQWHRRTQSPMQRLRGRASLTVSIATGKGARAFRLRHAPHAAVQQLLRQLSWRPRRGSESTAAAQRMKRPHEERIEH
ncbi:PH domain-containing protein [Paenibacillus albicereus]|uniref:PH domain-containing protein n=1 Tax=Paenibacillus albicereus TaxID=2726185 RepID=A0A6H2GSY7_9BACL|nr:PH domain-containing protein [Paenibacillus albicereus]QJC50469.1 PH domain-containing protein [Paenibacillus albicereus]